MHSEVGASNKARIVQCHGSVRLSRPHLPQAPTEETIEGDVADWVAQRYQAGFNVLPGSFTPVSTDVPVTDQMIQGAILWRDTVGREGVSQMFMLSETIHEQFCGTLDHAQWKPVERHLIVHEYKFGHRFIDAFECWQLIDYATAMLELLGELNAQDIRITLCVVQPRYYNAEPVREWELTSGQLRAYTNISHYATVEALGPNPMCKTGPECLDCPARVDCKTLQEATGHILEYVRRAESVAMQPNMIGRELQLIEDAAKLLDARSTGLRAQAESYFFGGKRIAGWTMERTEGRCKWVVPITEVIAAAKAAKVDIVASSDPQLITPIQAIKKGMPEAVVATLSQRPSKGWKLVRDDGTEATKVFSK